jgi:hypothetical protein
MPYFNWTNVTSPLDLFTYSNTVTNSWFGMLLIATIFLLLFISFKSHETEKAFAGASFLSTIFSLLLVIMGLLGAEYSIMMIILTSISVIFLLFRTSEKQSQ